MRNSGMVRKVVVRPIDDGSNSANEKMKPENHDSQEWTEFASSTTLHGLKHVVHRNHSPLKRVIWLLFLFAAASLFMFLSTISLRKFFSLPIKTVISLETPTNGLTFPAVTICNLNMFMRSKIDVADDDERFYQMGLNISGCSETRSVRGNLTCGQALLCAYQWFGPALVKGCNESTQQKIIDALNRSSESFFNEEDFLIRYGHEMRSMFVLYCRFKSVITCSDKDFVPHMTQEGLCFTFNSGLNDIPLHHTTYEGADFGLSIILDVQTNESTLNEFSTGFKVIVHEQNTFVNRYDGFNVLPGTHASALIKLAKIKRLPSPYKTNCRQMKLVAAERYTKDGCAFECSSNYTIKKCGCRRPGFPGPKTVPLCSTRDSDCVRRSRDQFNITSCSSCSNACFELEYEPRVSYSKFPDVSIANILHHYFHKTESLKYMQENYVFLQVGFQRLSYEMREDVPSYGSESLFGELGGNMGLLLGCSVLTICEFFDFLWESIKSRIRRPNEQNGVSSSEF